MRWKTISWRHFFYLCSCPETSDMLFNMSEGWNSEANLLSPPFPQWGASLHVSSVVASTHSISGVGMPSILGIATV